MMKKKGRILAISLLLALLVLGAHPEGDVHNDELLTANDIQKQ